MMEFSVINKITHPLSSKSLNETQHLTTMSLVIAHGHSDLPTGVLCGHL